MIETVTKKLAYTRKIILVTNGNGSLDADGLEAITTKCKDDGIELVVLYVWSFRLATNNADFVSVESTLTTRNMASRKRTRILSRYVVSLFVSTSY